MHAITETKMPAGSKGHGVGALLSSDVVSLPSWFPADKAAAVLRKTQKRFAVVTDRSGMSGIVTLSDLHRAGPSKSVSFVAVPLGEAVPHDASPTEVLSAMTSRCVTVVPVSMAGLVVGVLSREALEASLPKWPQVLAAERTCSRGEASSVAA